VLDGEEHLAVKVAWLIYQKIIAAYADPNRRRGKNAMTRLIDSIRRGVPAGLEEIAQLGRTLWRRRDDILAFFDHHASNGPTEAINGRLEALRRNALGFRNLTHYRWRSLLHSGAHYCTAAHTMHSSMHSELRRAGYASAINRSRSASVTTALVGGGRVLDDPVAHQRCGGNAQGSRQRPPRATGWQILALRLGANTVVRWGTGWDYSHWSAQFRDQRLAPETTAGLAGGHVVAYQSTN